MYLKYLTNEQAENFIKKYVKAYHINLLHCYENAHVKVIKIKKTNSSFKILTEISDKTGSIKNEWFLTTFKGNIINYGTIEELRDLTKSWAQFVYLTLMESNKEIAENFKNDYNSILEAEKYTTITSANQKFEQLCL